LEFRRVLFRSLADRHDAADRGAAHGRAPEVPEGDLGAATLGEGRLGAPQGRDAEFNRRQRKSGNQSERNYPMVSLHHGSSLLLTARRDQIQRWGWRSTSR